MSKKIETPHLDNWLKKFRSVGSTVGKITASTLGEMAPGVSGAASSASDVMRDTQEVMIKSRTKIVQQTKALNRSMAGRSARDVLEGAFNDIKNGSFSFSKLSDSSMDDVDDFDDILNEDNKVSYGEDGQIDPNVAALTESERSTAILGRTVAKGNAASIQGMENMTKTLATVTLKAADANTAKILNMNLMSMNQMSIGMTNVTNRLDSINQNIISMMDFQRSNVSALNQSTLEYQNTTSKMMNEMGKTLSEIQDFIKNQREIEKRTKRKTDEFDFSDGFDFNLYRDMVKKNFKNSSFGMGSSMLGMIPSMMSMMSMGGGNPIEMIAPMMIAGLMPKKIKKPIEYFDKAFTSGMNNLVYRLGDWRNSTDFLKSTIGQIFGKEREGFKGIKSLSDFKKDSMSWNGIAQKTLVEVIPSYLAKIEAGVNKSQERYFDMSTGQFQSIDSIEKRFRKSFTNTMEMGLHETTESITEALSKAGVTGNEASKIKDEVSKILYEAAVSDPRKHGKNRSESMRDLYGSLRGSLDDNTIHDIIRESMSGLDKTIQNLNDNIAQMTSAANHLFNDEKSDPSRFFASANLFSGRKIHNGSFIDTDTEDAEFLLAQQMAREEAISIQGKQRTYENIMKKILGNNYQNKAMYKNLLSRFSPEFRDQRSKEKERRLNERSARFNRRSNQMYDWISGFDFSNFENTEPGEPTPTPPLPSNTDSDQRVSSREEITRRSESQGNDQRQKSGRRLNYNPITQFNNRRQDTPFQYDSVALQLQPDEVRNNSQDIIPFRPRAASSRDTRESGNKQRFTRSGGATSRDSREKANGGARNDQIQSSINRSARTLAERNFNDSLNMSQREIISNADSSARLVHNMGSHGNEQGPSNGQEESAQNTILNRVRENEFSLKSLVLSLNDNFLSPIVGGLFGREGFFRNIFSDERIEKWRDKLFNEENGVFGSVTVWFKDQMKHLKYTFNGEAYTDSKGKKYEENENSVFDHIANGYDFIYRNTMKHLFGENYEENETYQKYFTGLDFKGKRDRKRRERISQAEMDKINLPNSSEENNVINFASRHSIENNISSNQMEENLNTASDNIVSITSRLRNISESLPEENKEETPVRSFEFNLSSEEEMEETNRQLLTNLLNASEEAGSNIVDASEKFSSTVFGHNDQNSQREIENEQRKTVKSFGSRVKEWLPKGLAAGTIGAGVGLSSAIWGKGIIGSLFLPGGPISGAILGIGTSLLMRNQKFQNFLFGEEKDGERQGGLISNKTQETFKKNLPLIVGGATLGALKGLIRGHAAPGGAGFFLNQLLPGGPIGGAMLGLGLSMLKSNERVNKILFGEKDEDGKKIGGIITSGKDKMKKIFSKSMPFIKGGVLGGAVGVGAALTLKHAGAIGQALSIGGPIGLGIAGLGMGIASQAERVKELLFGTEEFDEEGNSKGRRKDGLIHKVRNMMVVNILDPMRQHLQEKTEDFAYWAKDKITRPFELAFGPILDGFKGVKKDVSDAVHHAFNNVAETVGGALKTGIDTMFKPVTSAFGKMGKMITSASSTALKLSLSPLTGGLKLLQFGTRNLRRAAKGEERQTIRQHLGTIGRGIIDRTKQDWAEDDRDYGRGIVGSVNRFLTHGRDIFVNTKQGFDAAKASYRQELGEFGYNSLNWMNADDKARQDKKNRKKLLKDRKKWKEIDKVRSQLIHENDYGEAYLSSEGLERVKKRLGDAGFDKSLIRNNEDLNNFLYNKKDFLDRMKKGEDVSGGNNIKDSAATQDYYQTTKTYQNFVMNRFDFITKEFAKFAAQNALKKQNEGAIGIDALSNMDSSFRKMGFGWKDIGVDPSILVSETSISNEDWQRYMDEKFDGEHVNDDPTGFKSMIQSILDRNAKEAAKQEEQNEQIQSTLEHISQSSEATARMSMAEQAINTDASERETEDAAGFNTSSKWTRFKNFFSKKKRREANYQRELEESEKVRSGHKSTQDEQKEEEKEKTKEEKKEERKKTVLGTILNGILGFGGGIKSFFTSSTLWKALGIGTGAVALFGQDIADVMSHIIKKVTPIVDPVIDKVKEEVPELLHQAGDYITEKAPEFIASMTDRVVNNMDFILTNAGKILGSAVTTLFKKGANFVATKLGQKEPFPEFSNVKNKTFKTKEEADQYYEETGDFYRETIDEEGNVSYELAKDNTYTDPETGEVKNIGVNTLGADALKFGKKFATNKTTRTLTKWGAKAGLFALNPIAGAAGVILPGPLGKAIKGGIKGTAKVGRTGIDAVSSLGSKVGKALGNVAEDASQKPAVLQKIMGFLTKAKNLIKGASNTVSKFIKEKNFFKAIDGFFTKITTKLASSNIKTLNKIAEKLTTKASSATGKSVAGMTPLAAGFLIADIAYGWNSASYLFGIDQSNVTTGMKAVSSILSALMGTAVGVWISLVLDVAYILSDYQTNPKQELAHAIYKALGGDAGLLEEATLEMEAMTYKYNKETQNHLSTNEFNELYNKENSGFFSMIKKNINKFGVSIGLASEEKYNEKYGKDKYKVSQDDINEYKNSAAYRAKHSNDVVTSTSNYMSEDSSSNSDEYDQLSYDGTDLLGESARLYGRGPNGRYHGKFYGPGLNQADPRWANFSLGKFPNGKESTMATGGCGPTALSMVANSLGSNDISPLGVANYAKKSGMIQDGGANTDLFTKGASSMGLNVGKVDRSNLKKNLAFGNPVILSGKSSENGPYTEAGHVVVANGLDKRGNIIVNDPMRGERSVSESSLTKDMTHGWSYSSGDTSYGVGPAGDKSRAVGYGFFGNLWDSFQNMIHEDSSMSADERAQMSYKGGKWVYPENSYFDYNGRRFQIIPTTKSSARGSVKPFMAVEINKSTDVTGWAQFKDNARSYFQGKHPWIEVVTKESQQKSKQSAEIAKTLPSADPIISNIATSSDQSAIKVKSDIQRYTTASEKYERIKREEEEYKKTGKWASIDPLKDNSNIVGLSYTSDPLLDPFGLKSNPTPDPLITNSSKSHLFESGSPSILGTLVNQGTLKNQRALEGKIQNGFVKVGGEYKFNQMEFYRGLKVADIRSMAVYQPKLLSDPAIPKFKAVHKYFVESKKYAMTYTIMDRELKIIFGVSEFVTALGGNGYYQDWEYKYGFPFFQTDDERWASIPWRGESVKSRGGDLASLAMVATAFSPNMLSPDYIYDNWLNKQKDWWTSSNGLEMDKVFADGGYNAMKAAHMDGKRVQTNKIQNRASILSALKSKKPVVLTGQRYLGSLFGGYYDINSAPTNGPDDYSTIVARAADDNQIVVLDPFTTLDQSGVFDVERLNDIVGSNTPAIRSAYSISGPNGEGIDSPVDISSKEGGVSDYVPLSEAKGLEKIGALFKNVGAIFSHFFEFALGSKGEKYRSIYDVNPIDDDGMDTDNQQYIIRNENGVEVDPNTGMAIESGNNAITTNTDDTGYKKSNAETTAKNLQKMAMQFGWNFATRGASLPNTTANSSSNESKAMINFKNAVDNAKNLKKNKSSKKNKITSQGIRNLEKAVNNMGKKKQPTKTSPKITELENIIHGGIGSGSRDLVFGKGGNDKGVAIQQYNGKLGMTSSPNRDIDYIVMHYTAGTHSEVGTAKSVADYFNSGNAGGSADFIADDGSIIQYNPDIKNQYTHAVGGTKYSSMTTQLGGSLYGKAKNANTVSIEMTSSKKNRSKIDAMDDDWYFTEDTMKNSAAIANTLMAQLNIPKKNVIMHHHVTGKVCPAMWTRNEQALTGWSDFRKRLNGEDDGLGNGVMLTGTTDGSASTVSSENTAPPDEHSLSYSQRIAAIGSASMAAMMGEDYKTAKDEAIRKMLGSTGSSTENETTTTGDGSPSVGNFTFSETNGEEKPVPQGYGKVLSYMAWQKITSPSSMQYKLKQEAEGYDTDGMGKVGDRYAVAVKPYYGLTGDLLNIRREDGTTQKLIVADVKGSENGTTGLAQFVHSDGSVVEYVIDGNKFKGGDSTYKGTKTVHDVHPEWAKNILGITKVGNFWQNKTSYGIGPLSQFRHSRAVGYGGNWLGIVAETKKALAGACSHYSQGTFVNITVGGITKSVRTDCSGFVGAALYFYGVPDALNTSSHWYSSSNSSLSSHGFKYMAWPGWEGLQPGDIIANLASHVEIFAGNQNGKHMVYNAGSTSSITNPGTTASSKASYECVWRPNAAGSVNGTNTSTGESDYNPLDPWSKFAKKLSDWGQKALTINGKPIAFGKGNKPKGSNNPASWFTKTLGGSISSGYGQRNTSLGSEFHRGMDIEAEGGTNILSPVSGEIVSSGSDVAGYGNYAVVRDTSGNNHLFAHMKKPVSYGLGDVIGKNDVVGQVGSSGNATGDHLHYEIRKNGNKYSAVNPFDFKYDKSDDYNINSIHRKASSQKEDLPAVGSGNKDISTTVKEKLDVAINTGNIEDKMNKMIEALKIIADNSSKPIPATANTINNTTNNVYGPGGKQQQIITTGSKPKKPTSGSKALAEIHKSIASVKR